MDHRWRTIAWAALVVQIPFELKYTLGGLSNLQWTFLALAVINIPSLYAHRQELKADRMVQAAALFVAIQWMAAFLAPEFNGNAWKGAIRFTIGFTLLAMALLMPDRKLVPRIWAITSFCAAVYALAAKAGLGLPWLFRNGEFFVAKVQRLSGSFGYPNIAAAYFAMSLPMVWWSSFRPALRWIAAVVLWCALILTFSRSAAAAVAVVSIGGALLAKKKQNEWRMDAGLIGTGIAAVILLTSFNPQLIDVLKRSGAENPPAAQYKMTWNRLREEPGAQDSVQLSIRNAGTIAWLAQSSGRVAVAYRWRNMETQGVETGSLVTALPHDVRPGETIELPVAFQTPASPGQYRLIVELFVRKFDWFSNAGVMPAVIDADIQRGATRAIEEVDRPSGLPIQTDPRAGTGLVPRFQLWRAAIRMFRSHPFGVGPDNYRLLYGRFLGLSSWNTNIYSNNLYLELLTGSGILGLAGFGLVIISIPHRIMTPSLMAVAVFLVHGCLDVFLMTTPIYFSFWILAGICREVTREN